MVNFHEIKVGDYLQGEYEGKMWWGEVTGINNDEKQVALKTEVQNFWFEHDKVFPVPLSDEALMRLNFIKELDDNGEIKYKKGPFRILIPKENDWANMVMWYREDHRFHPEIKYLHQLQNQYHSMTKMYLTDSVMI